MPRFRSCGMRSANFAALADGAMSFVCQCESSGVVPLLERPIAALLTDSHCFGGQAVPWRASISVLPGRCSGTVTRNPRVHPGSSAIS